jgi:hypothetical protein
VFSPPLRAAREAASQCLLQLHSARLRLLLSGRAAPAVLNR